LEAINIELFGPLLRVVLFRSYCILFKL